MSISTALAVTLGATSAAPTGGSSSNFIPAGIQNGGVLLYCDDDNDLRTQRSLQLSTKAPKVSVGAPNGYTQARATVLFKSPLTLDNGNITVNTVRIETSYDPETSQAEVLELRMVGAQALYLAAIADFYENLSLG